MRYLRAPRWMICVGLLLALAVSTTASAQDGDDSPAQVLDPDAPSSTPPQSDDEEAEDVTQNASIALRDETIFPIRIGEPTTVHLRAQLPPDAQLVSLRPIGNRFVERLDSTAMIDSSRPRLDLTVFRPGDYRFRIEAVWIDAGGHQHTMATNELTLSVLSTLENTSDHALLPPGPYLSLRSRNIWLIAATLGASLMALVWISSVFWRRRHAPLTETDPGPPPRPAWDVALEDIRTLRQDEDLLAHQPIVFHHRMSEILRTWIQGRLKIAAPEMTSEEILQELRPRRLVLGDWIDRIESILEDTDLVKFAKFAPSQRDSLLLLDQLELLVREVKASDEAPPPAIPSPIDHDEPPIAPSRAAAPQTNAPGEANPKYSPEGVHAGQVISMKFRESPDHTQGPQPSDQGKVTPFWFDDEEEP